jgi:putative glutamine amidotransferase
MTKELSIVPKGRTPVIGIPGWKVGDNSFGCTVAYMYHFQHFGDVKILPLIDEVDPSIDLLVIPGGPDVDTRRYRAIPGLLTSKPDPFKEYFDTIILPRYIEVGVPVFGICRGLQSIAVLFGARLVQHMYHETNTDLTGRDALVHDIVLNDTEFKRSFEEETHVHRVRVNSMHHQCVSSVGLPDELEILGLYKTPNKSSSIGRSSIEVIRHKTLPIIAVQYHPEELVEDPLGDFIVDILIKQSKNYKEIR